MTYPFEANQELLQEIFVLKQRIQELEKSESERKQIEAALRKSEASYRQLFDNCPTGIYQVNFRTGKFSKANDAFCEYLGYNQKEITSLTPYDILTKESRKIFTERVNKITSGEEVSANPEFEIINKNGQRRWVQLNTKIIYDSEGLAGADVVAHDITDRKWMENLFLESENKFKNLVEQAHAGIYLIQDGIFKYVNPQFARMFGYTIEECLNNMPFRNLVYPEDVTKVEEQVRRRMTSEAEFIQYSFRGLKKNGRIFHVEVYGSAGVHEERPASTGTILDITERRQMEEALREKEAQYRNFFTTSRDCVFITSVDGYWIDLNDAAVQLFGYDSREELMKMKIIDLYVNPDDRMRHNRLIAGQGYVEEMPVKLRKKDGMAIDTLITSATRKDSTGKIIGYQGTIRDITEHRKAEEALLESEERYKSLVNNVNVGINFIDKDFKIITTNVVSGKQFHKPPDELVGKKCFEEFEKRQTICQHCPGVRAMATGLPQQVITNGIRDDGSRFTALIHAFPLFYPDGTIKGFNEVVEDITEHQQVEEEKRRLEERLQRAEKMEALGTLAGGVAHDLNNVLGVVVGYAEMLLMNADKSSPIRPQLVNIMKGGQSAAAIVDDLLTLARRGVPVRQVLNLNKIISNLQQSPEFEKLLSYHPSVKLKTDLEPDLLNISGSFVHLGKMLFNLLSNACEAMPQGGILIVSTAGQYLDRPIQGYDEVREGDYVVLSVSDTGQGIPAADLKRIFEPFYTKKVMGRSGTGLGLAVVWGTVKDHHGYINIQSEEGKGSTFTIFFPSRGKISPPTSLPQQFPNIRAVANPFWWLMM